ncbi:YeeE/YedE family protein [Salinisphaera sp. RV14]|uniref:YeeE/YedE family protein n=1 Tax=unclassified Salinisphaera TaxID=2649847 RepID=UPI003F860693
MLTPITNFTPGIALGGGLLIGAGAVLLMAGLGRIAGISGMVHGLFSGQPGHGWRASFLVGLVAGAGVYVALWPGDIPVRHGFPVWLLILAGLLVGAGTRLGSGCTSGHGVCGIARRSKRSLTATTVFMACGIITAIILRHGLGVSS